MRARKSVWSAVLALGLPAISSAQQIAIAEYPLPTAASYAYGIAAGPDGALWFTEWSANRIGRITTAGAVTEYPVPTANPLGSRRDRTALCGSPRTPPTRSGGSPPPE